MRALTFAKQRLTAFHEELARLERAEMLEMLGPGSDLGTVKQVCQQQLTDLWDYLPFLGFILRSTNVRNAFEIYTPLARLAWRVLGPEAKLLLSSEWDYSTFVYTQVPLLPGFVLIGIPAHESGNPLVAPLAGHEMGHALWAEVVERSLWHPAFLTRLKASVLAKIRASWADFHRLHPEISTPDDLETELFATAAWAPAFAWAQRQSEEYFCDFVGLRLFGESFLYAFAHLLSPVVEGMRALHYPNMLRRVRFQMQAALRYGIQPPANYESWFKDRDEPSDEDRHEKFLVELADSAADELAPELISHADSLLRRPGLPDRSTEELRAEHAATVQRIYDDFCVVAPAEKTGHLVHILNAGWKAAMDNVPQVADHSPQEILRELVLKSLEVLEYETKNAAPA